MANALDKLLELSNAVIAQCFLGKAEPIESNPFKLAAKFADEPVVPKAYNRKAATSFSPPTAFRRSCTVGTSKSWPSTGLTSATVTQANEG